MSCPLHLRARGCGEFNPHPGPLSQSWERGLSERHEGLAEFAETEQGALRSDGSWAGSEWRTASFSDGAPYVDL